MIVAMDQAMPKAGEEVPVFVKNKELSKQGITSEDLAILSVGGVSLAILLLFGGKIATTALLVSTLTVGGGVILWIKMPSKVKDVPLISTVIRRLPIDRDKKKWILSQNWKEKAENYELLLDILVSAGVICLFGTTVTGILSAAMTGLMVSAIIRFRKMTRRISFQVKEGFKEYSGTYA